MIPLSSFLDVALARPELRRAFMPARSVAQMLILSAASCLSLYSTRLPFTLRREERRAISFSNRMLEA
jgi:hypothetical protein